MRENMFMYAWVLHCLSSHGMVNGQHYDRITTFKIKWRSRGIWYGPDGLKSLGKEQKKIFMRIAGRRLNHSAKAAKY